MLFAVVLPLSVAIDSRETLGQDSLRITASSVRHVDSLRDFVFEYAHNALSADWKNQSGRVAEAVLEVSNQYGFDPLLVLAMIQNESRFRPEVIGTHGEIGLMQIKPVTARWIARKAGFKWSGARMLHDPAMNVRIGAAYLAMLRSKFGPEKNLYLAAYNMGVTNLYRALHANLKPQIYAQKTNQHYSRIYIEFIGGTKKAAPMRTLQRSYAAI